MNKFFKGKITCGLIVILMVMTVVACSGKKDGGSASGGKVQYDPESDFKAVPTDGGKGIVIARYVGVKREVSIPPRIQGLPVTGIGSEAFRERNLSKVTIPNSVTTIGSIAFGDNQLIRVIIPDSVTTIEYNAFDHNQLISVTIPNNITTIESYAFGRNQLISVIIPNSVTTIEERAFADNPLTSITIGAGVIIKYEIIGIRTGLDKHTNSGFTDFYNKNGKAAGTYTRPDAESTVWTKK